MKTTRAGLLAVLLPALAGCQASAARPDARPSPGASPAAAAGAGEVMAHVDGVPITRAELDERVEDRLARLRQEEYDIRRQALDQLIGELLMEKEAQRRGISKDDLIKDEVERQVPAPEQSQVDSLYQQHKGRFGATTEAKAKAEITRVLRERSVAARREAFRKQLAEKAQVKVLLDAPRIPIQVPAGAPALGPASAPVVIVEFSDYQCPFCHRAQETVNRVLSTYGEKVQFVHLDFPLDGHAQAVPAARAARCAGEQGKFWEYHRGLMMERGDLTDADLKARAAKLSLEPAKFATCLASDRYDAAIQGGFEDGAKVGVSGTPTYFINGRMLTGARPFEQFQEVIDSELARSR
jgi:protein-disulfide isomerase